MYSGTIIANNRPAAATGHVFGGAVRLQSTNAIFNMRGGIIGGPNPGDGHNSTSGGAVNVHSGATFNMSGSAVLQGNYASCGPTYNGRGGAV